MFGGAAPANLGIALDVRGPILSTANSCASGAVALGEALGDLREGRVDAAIAGGCEVPLSPLAFGAFDIIRALSAGATTTTPARPPGRSTPSATGSSWARARRCSCSRPRRSPSARRATVRRAARLRRDLRRPPHGPAARRRPRGRRAATIALADAGVDPDEIDYVNAHASSTPIGDVAEARAIARRSASGRRRCPVSGTKALYGHPLGASGAIEAAICALAIRDGWAPASVNLETPDPEVAALLPGLLRAGAGPGPTGGCCRPRSGSAG